MSAQEPARHANNFDALRVFAAALVILSHSWSLARQLDEPVAEITRGSINGGALGVWMFFAISGYLVSQSFVQRAHLAAFIEARFLRIYPAFVACILFGVLVGAIATTLPLPEYLRHPQTWGYVGNNLIYELRYDLPGVFAGNAHPNAVNGSIWTLPAETMMYVGVATLGMLTLLRRTGYGAVLLLGLLAALSIDPWLVTRIPYIDSTLYAPAVRCFVLGVLLYVLRGRLPLHGGGVIVILAATILFGQQQPPGTLMVCILIAYTTLWLAFHPRIALRIPDRIGDTSYGLYVYAFPIQQLVCWRFPHWGPWAVFLASFACTFVVAWCSWHALEKPALAMKGTLARVFVRRA